MENTQDLINEWKGNAVKLQSEQMQGMMQYHSSVFSDGALDKKTKHLVAIGTALTAGCNWCVALHVDGALKAGASREQILEASWAVAFMGGGPALMHMQLVIKALDDFGA